MELRELSEINKKQKKTLTIPFCSDKIAPVADDGALKSRTRSGQPETRRRNSRGQESGTKGAGSAEKTDEKNC